MSLCWAAAKKDDDLDPENGHAVKPEQLRTDTEQENDLNNNRNLTSRTLLRVLVLALITLSAAASFAQDDTDLKFKGGIGVVPVTGVAANGTVNLNIVRGVSPGGPWRIAALNAEVESNGHIKVNGRGLLLASGNGIGTNAGQTVHATLFCGLATSATAFDSRGVALAANGDFAIDDFLSSTPTLPCVSPVLLIRNVVGVWFAAGIPSTEKDRDRD
jgi:hypothetical protein